MSSEQLPTSDALVEAGAGAESLTELLSRDPEGYQRQDRDRIVEALRAARVKWQAAEAAGRSKAGTRGPQLAKGLKPDDLGI